MSFDLLGTDLKAKAKQFYKVLREHSVSQEDPIPEWTIVQDCEGDGATECICTTPILHQYTIQNSINGKLLTIGSECIKRWHIKVRCKICSSPLGNLTKRLRDNNYLCPQCTRIEKKKEKIKEHHRQLRIQQLRDMRLLWFGKYYKRRFCDVVNDIPFTESLLNIPSKSKSLQLFEEYVTLTLGVQEVQVEVDIEE